MSRRARGKRTKTIVALNEVLDAIVPRGLRRLRGTMTDVELAILDRRVAPQRPDTFDELAAEHGLLEKLRNFWN